MSRRGITFAVVGLLCAILIPPALAEQPRFLKDPDVDLLDGQKHLDTPPAVPRVGDTLYGNNGSPDCSPACDPSGDSTNPKKVILPGSGDPPSGQFYSWRRCNDTGCVEVKPKATFEENGHLYTVKAEDAHSKLQLVVWLTNLDCGEVVREGPDAGRQECRYSTTRATVTSETVQANAAVAVAPESLPSPRVGEVYQQALAASNGTGPYSFSVSSGTLPAGLSLSPAGVLNGTPTAAGNFTFTVQATAAGAVPGSRTYTLAVEFGMPTLANGVTGVAYAQALPTVGSTGAVTFAVASGALPDGLGLSGAQLAGTPTKQGTFTFTLRGTDAAGNKGAKQYTVTIGYPTLALGPAALPTAVRGVVYEAALTATGGTAPYRWVLLTGKLPRGLRLSPDGVISGKAKDDETHGQVTLAFSVTDKYGAPATKEYSLPYHAPSIELSQAGPVSIVAGTKFRLRLRANGGDGPYTFARRTGRLPPGIRLGERGMLIGIATRVGSFHARITVTDELGAFTIVPVDFEVVAAADQLKPGRR